MVLFLLEIFTKRKMAIVEKKFLENRAVAFMEGVTVFNAKIEKKSSAIAEMAMKSLKMRNECVKMRKIVGDRLLENFRKASSSTPFSLDFSLSFGYIGLLIF